MLRGAKERMPELASFVIPFIINLLVYTRYPLMYGIDGPYYIIQERSLITNGWIKYPDPPLAFLILAPFYLLGGGLGIKIGVVFFISLSSLLIFRTIKSLSKSSLVALFSSIVFGSSPYIMPLYTDFIKNALGLLFIISFFYSLFCIKDSKIRVTCMVSSVIACSLTHVLDFGVLGLMILLSAPSFLIVKEKEGFKEVAISLLLVGSMLILAFTIPSLVGGDVSKLVSFLEEGVVEEEAMGFFGEIPIHYGFAIGGLIYSIFRKDKTAILVLPASLVALAINFPLIAPKWAFRFSLMNSVTFPLIIPAFLQILREDWKKVMIIMLIIGFLVPIGIRVWPRLKPSIPLGEWEEIRDLTKVIPVNSTLFVPNTKLRYWVEAEIGDQYDVKGRNTDIKPPFYIITEVSRPPPKGRTIYEGSYIVVNLIGRFGRFP